MGQPQVDLFASCHTKLLPVYITLDQKDSQASAIEALAQDWDFRLVYAFPPPSLVPTVLCKLADSSCRMLLLAPCWCDTPWLPVLLRHLYARPHRLRWRKDLITVAQTGMSLKQLISSWSPGIRRHYAAAFKSWEVWYSSRNLEATSISVEKLSDYSNHLLEKGLAWRTIGVHRSAISTLLETDQERPAGQHPLVSRFVKGVFKVRPPVQTLDSVLDVSKVLDLLRLWSPVDNVELVKLTYKTVMLLSLVTAKRVHDLTLLRISAHLHTYS